MSDRGRRLAQTTRAHRLVEAGACPVLIAKVLGYPSAAEMASEIVRAGLVTLRDIQGPQEVRRG